MRSGFAAVLTVNGVLNATEGDWILAGLSLLLGLLLLASLLASTDPERHEAD